MSDGRVDQSISTGWLNLVAAPKKQSQSIAVKRGTARRTSLRQADNVPSRGDRI